MDREGQATTDGRALAERFGRVGLWTRQLDVQPAKQVREAIAERVRAHLDAGADHVCVQLLDPDHNGLPMAGWRALSPALLER